MLLSDSISDPFGSLELVYQSDSFVAINKPHGLLVHRSKIANDAQVFALQKLRDQLNKQVFLCHRLDRKTSGVLLFTTNREANAEVQSLFRDRFVDKTYYAIVRGYTPDQGEIDYPIGEENKTKQEAFTRYKSIERYEISLPHGKFNTSRYSLVKVMPETGRFHQIRKHFAHLRHPILGDRPHGCNKQNRLWKDKFNMTSMMLHAQRLQFEYMKDQISIEADFSSEWKMVVDILRSYPELSSI